MRGLLRASLAAEGFAVTTAVSLSEATRAARSTTRPTSSCSTSACPTATAPSWCARCAGRARCRSSSPRRGTIRPARSPCSTPAPTTTWSSRSASASCWRASASRCAIAARRCSRRCGASSATAWRIDLDARRVERDGEPVHLTPTEFELLARLVRGGGRIVTHRQLLADVWGAEHVDGHPLPAALHGPAARQARALAVRAAPPAHRDRRRLPLRRRLKRSAARAARGRAYAFLMRRRLQSRLRSFRAPTP